MVFERNLSKSNIDQMINIYERSIENIGKVINDKTGIRLLESLKRDKINVKPYPNVTFFEAANRIMTDLVILHGVSWLLKYEIFPFDSYTVEYGNENNNGFDIMAISKDMTLVGEAFNVAPSFYQGKKSKMLQKLRTQNDAAFKIIMVNSDAVFDGYLPKKEINLYYVFVDIFSRSARIEPTDHQ